jgi:hypothetical protein
MSEVDFVALKDEAVELLESGMDVFEVALALDVDVDFVRNIVLDSVNAIYNEDY